MKQQTVNIEVRAEGSGPPLEIRLRRALKWMLRSHGLRAVRVSDGKVPAKGNRNTVKPAENEPVFTERTIGATQGGNHV